MSAQHRLPTRRLGRRLLLAGALVGVLAAAAPAQAARNAPAGNGNTAASGLSLVLLDSPDAVPNYGESVTFALTTSVAKPSVNLLCYQGATLVYAHSAGFFADYPWPQDRVYTLRSTAWTGGPAECTAELRYVNRRGAYVSLATLHFSVLG